MFPWKSQLKKNVAIKFIWSLYFLSLTRWAKCYRNKNEYSWKNVEISEKNLINVMRSKNTSTDYTYHMWDPHHQGLVCASSLCNMLRLCQANFCEAVCHSEGPPLGMLFHYLPKVYTVIIYPHSLCLICPSNLT